MKNKIIYSMDKILGSINNDYSLLLLKENTKTHCFYIIRTNKISGCSTRYALDDNVKTMQWWSNLYKGLNK